MASIAAPFARVRDLWSASNAGWLAAIAAVLGLTGLLLAQLLLIGQKN